MAAPTLVVTPRAADARLARDFLQNSGIDALTCGTLSELGERLSDDVGCVVLVEEALTDDELPFLADALQRQPPWSDLPLILVASEGAALSRSANRIFPNSGNVTLLERPLNPAMLVAAVQVALRARARQFQVRDLLLEREEAVRLRDEFLAMLAHELRNPLAPMRNAVYIQQKLGIDDPALVRTQQILDRQITHLARMVDDLLDVARLERGRVQLHRERLELNGLVTAAVDACLAAAQMQGHALNIAMSSEPLYVDADPVRIEQLITNLIMNAAKFTPKAGEISISTARENRAAVVSVRDNGIGIRPEMLERIFDPFTQDDRTLARSAGGLGIGLTIAHRLATLHGGTLQAASEGRDRGATFIARFPLADGAAPIAPAPTSADGAGRKRRVLVIEDNDDIRESLSIILEMWGHDVMSAANGRAGLDLAGKSEPDIALIDIGLPGMNGYDLARAIRESKTSWSSNIKLIAITGYGQPTDRERALTCGFDGHLLKPIDPKVLQKMLAS